MPDQAPPTPSSTPRRRGWRHTCAGGTSILTSVALSEASADWLRAQADAEHVSVSSLVRDAVDLLCAMQAKSPEVLDDITRAAEWRRTLIAYVQAQVPA